MTDTPDRITRWAAADAAEGTPGRAVHIAQWADTHLGIPCPWNGMNQVDRDEYARMAAAAIDSWEALPGPERIRILMELSND